MTRLLSANHLDLALIWPSVNPYWADRLSALAATSNIRFECWLLDRNEADRDWVVAESSLQFPHRVLPASTHRAVGEVVRAYAAAQPQHVLSMHFDPRLWIALPHHSVSRRDLAFYVEKTWDTWIERTKAKEFAKSFVFRQASTFLTPGEDASQWVLPYAARGARHHKLPHVVDCQRFESAHKDRTPAARVRFLYLGRYIPEKGLESMLRAFELAGTRISSGLFELSVIGSGPMAADLQQWALRQQFKVTVEGFVQPRDLPARLAAHDVLVFPTLGDPYGLVVNEAFAAGMPVISSDHAGEIHQRIGSDPNTARGWLHLANDPRAMSEMIIDAISDAEGRSRRAENAFSYARKNLDVPLWVTAIEDWVCSST